MNVLELHRDLVNRILSVEDQAVLERLRQHIIKELEADELLIEGVDDDDDWAENLTDEQIESLDKARRAVRLPENQMSHDEAMKRLKLGEYGTDLVSASR